MRGNAAVARLDGHDTCAAHLNERVAPHARDLAPHAITPANAVEIVEVGRDRRHNEHHVLGVEIAQRFEESVMQRARQIDVVEHRVGEFAFAGKVA